VGVGVLPPEVKVGLSCWHAERVRRASTSHPMISSGVAVVVRSEPVRASMSLLYFQTVVFPPDWTEIVTEDDEDHQQKVPGSDSHESGCPFNVVPMQKEVQTSIVHQQRLGGGGPARSGYSSS
jgi:hypothetical protein